MKKLVLCLILMLPAVSVARTVTINTGMFQVQLNDYGRIRIFSADGTRNMDRVSLLAGLNASDVFDYYEDAGTRRATDSTGSTFPQSLEIFGVFDNSYTGYPPAVAESVHIYTWMNKKFAICEFFLTNETGQANDFYVSLELISQIGGTYENDTSEIVSERLVCMHDGSANSAVGFLLLVPSAMYSYRADPWGNHQYDDSYYWSMMTSSQSDNFVVGDADGVYGVLNAGLYSSVPNGGSIHLVLGLVYGHSVGEIISVSQECIDYYQQYFGVAENPQLLRMTNTFVKNNVLSFYSEYDHATWSILDASGKVIAAGQIARRGLNTITLGESIPKGVYFIRVEGANYNSLRKFVVIQ